MSVFPLEPAQKLQHHIVVHAWLMMQEAAYEGKPLFIMRRCG
jgi:hypothetical protein